MGRSAPKQVAQGPNDRATHHRFFRNRFHDREGDRHLKNLASILSERGRFSDGPRGLCAEAGSVPLYRTLGDHSPRFTWSVRENDLRADGANFGQLTASSHLQEPRFGLSTHRRLRRNTPLHVPWLI